MTGIASPRGGFWRLVEAIQVAFCKLHRIQFEAPWKARRPDC